MLRPRIRLMMYYEASLVNPFVCSCLYLKEVVEVWISSPYFLLLCRLVDVKSRCGRLCELV